MAAVSVSARVRLETLATQATMGMKMKKWLTKYNSQFELREES